MKKKLTISELKSLIKEEAHKLQRRTLLEGEKKKLMKEMSEISSSDKVYINGDLANEFDFPLRIAGAVRLINAGTLENSSSEWDSEHLEIFEKYRGKDLLLKGVGYGWWEITKSYKFVPSSTFSGMIQ